MIPQDTVQRILDTAEITEVISDFVSLKKRGVNHIGLCPFHNEKTPSFTVSSAKGIFKCFGCGKGGNVVNFIMELEQLSYVEALKYLAGKYNIEIVEKELTAEQKQAKNRKESLYVITSFAKNYFSDLLHNSSEGKSVGMSYMRQRGFNDHIIKKFEIGYSLAAKNAFTKNAIEQGYKLEGLTQTGLSIVGENYQLDRFHGRVLFPIHSLTGKILGFGGRLLKNDKKAAKYLNSPESEIYHKSDILYGIYFARQDIVKNDKCYMVEGYTDVMALHQAGIGNVVASSGTSLTVNQIRLVKRLSKNLTFIYDGDQAGIKASLRGIDLVLEEGMNVKVVLLPENEDPDSFAKKNNAGELINYIDDNEVDFISFKTKLLLNEASDDPIKKASLISDIVRSISVISDSIVRSVYIKKCSNMLGLAENALYSEINKIRYKKAEKDFNRKKYQSKNNAAETKPAPQNKSIELLEREIIRLLLLYGDREFKILIPEENEYERYKVAEYIISEFEYEEFSFASQAYQNMFNRILQKYEEEKTMDIRFFTNHSESQISSLAVEIITSNYTLSKIWNKDGTMNTREIELDKAVPELMLKYKMKKINIERENIMTKIQNSEKRLSEDEIMQLLQNKMALDKLTAQIAKELGDMTII